MMVECPARDGCQRQSAGGVLGISAACGNNPHRPPSLSLQALQKVESGSGSLPPCLNLGVEGA